MVFKARPVDIPLKFTFTVSKLLYLSLAHLERSYPFNTGGDLDKFFFSFIDREEEAKRDEVHP
jgi:hypothetical protein